MWHSYRAIQARTCGVVVKTADFGAADPSSNPRWGGKFGSLFQSNLKESVGGFTHLACWEVASPVILRLGGKGHVAECDSEGVCTHLGASLVKVKQKPKSVAKLTHSLGG